jgi:uncharacterized damage-inducible protein DinB
VTSAATSGPATRKDPAKEPTTAHTSKTRFLDAYHKEHATTMRVLRAYPPSKLDLRPHPKGKSARELAAVFSSNVGLALKALTTGFDWSKPPARPQSAPAESLDAIVAQLERDHAKFVEIVEKAPDHQLNGTVQFFVAPKQLGDVPMLDFLWMTLFDQVHHRGQFSVYLRMADGKVPSIYGPTADEPWI